MKKLFSLLMALCLLCAALPVVAENANSDRAAAIRAKFLEKADEVVVTDTSVIFTDAASETPLEITKNPGKTAVLYGSLCGQKLEHRKHYRLPARSDCMQHRHERLQDHLGSCAGGGHPHCGHEL